MALHPNAKANLRRLEAQKLLEIAVRLKERHAALSAWDATPNCRRALGQAIKLLQSCAAQCLDESIGPKP